MPVRLTSRFEQALVYAAQFHREQRRKGSNIPYVSHLLAVAGIVLEHRGDDDEVIAALLHDAIEDQGGPGTRDEILRRFGERVTRVVEGCTDAWTDPKPRWKDRKRAYIERLKEAPALCRLVSAADKLHNACSILSDYRNLGDEVWKRLGAVRRRRCGTTGRWWTLWWDQVGRRLWTNWPGLSAKSNGLRAVDRALLVRPAEIGEPLTGGLAAHATQPTDGGPSPGAIFCTCSLPPSSLSEPALSK